MPDKVKGIVSTIATNLAINCQILSPAEKLVENYQDGRIQILEIAQKTIICLPVFGTFNFEIVIDY